MVSSTSFNQNDAWKFVKNARKSHEKNPVSDTETLMKCKTLAPLIDIRKNMEFLSNITKVGNNIRDSQDLEKSTITKAAKMFLYLNSCKHSSEGYWKFFYDDLIFNSIDQSRDSFKTIILLTLTNVMKKASWDGRRIAEKIVEKISPQFGTPDTISLHNTLSMNCIA